ncbi:MAG: FUSC family protein [Acidobacteria bacterium]|nr:FUSC family protein [Acidobacteriota bacterium]
MTHFQDFFRVAPARDDHFPALRCAVSVALPLCVLMAAGHIELAIFAVFGAFTAVFGRGESYRQRLFHQSSAAGLLIAAVLLGMLNSLYAPGAWWIVGSTAVVAGAARLASGQLRLGSPGAFFPLFAFGATSVVPIAPSASGPAALWCIGSAALALLIGVSGRFIRAWADRPAAARTGTAPPESLRREVRSALVLGAAVAMAGAISTVVGIGHSYWAMLSAAVPLMAVGRRLRVYRGLSRILGTFLGLGLLWLLLLMHLQGWWLIAVVVVLQFMTEMLVARHYGLAMIFITPLALLMTELAHSTDVAVLMRDRAVETLIGAAVGMAAALLAAAYRPGPEKRTAAG